MKEVWIRLSSTKDIQQFVGALASLSGDFELVSGQYVLDARSLMGIFGFDLSKPLCLKVYNDNAQNLDAVRPFLTDMEETYYE